MIQLVRLTSGEEIVGEVQQFNDYLVITKGASLMPTGDGKLGFMPFMQYAKGEEVKIKNEHHMFTLDCEDAMIEAYEKIMNPSLIKTQSKKIIV
jgi:hypothetical protein